MTGRLLSMENEMTVADEKDRPHRITIGSALFPSLCFP
jgi:hypothetical protein